MNLSDTFEVTLPGDREIRMTRVFDATPEMVFDAFTNPEIVKRWLLGPDGWSMPVCEIDLREGGAFHYVWRSDEDGTEFGIRGNYTEIDAPGHMVHTETMEGIPGAEGESIVTNEIAEEDGKTRMTMTVLYPSKEARDGAKASGMETGVAISYDRLESIFEDKARAA
ncbi:MAG: SRPBCC family protein [Aridibacter famidurans]|nr:SRPBCC family protein [Aridibacter famidurans]